MQETIQADKNKTETSAAKSQNMASRSALCECGNEITPVGNSRISLTPANCPECEDRLNQEIKHCQQDEIEQVKQKKIDSEIERVIPDLFRNAKIDDFPKAIQNTLLALDGRTGLYLWGESGRGKTHAMAAIARDYIQARIHVERRVWERLLCEIRAVYSRKGKTEEKILKPLLECKLLILEDLGTSTSMDGRESDFALRILLMILDARIEKGLPTGITSNKSVEVIKDTFDDRIFSRIVGHFEIKEFTGSDRRLSQK